VNRIISKGNMVGDDLVEQVVSSRLRWHDWNYGFVLDGFPRTVPQAEALDRLLAERGLKLDAVIELKVDEGILIKRIETRVAQMTARGDPLRKDDNPEVLKDRLAAYRAQTAPLAGYYAAKGMLKAVDGMAPIDDVTLAIDAILSPAKAKAAAPVKRRAKKATKKPKTAKARAAKKAKKVKKTKTKTKSAAKRATAKMAARKAAKSSKKRKSGRKAAPAKRKPGRRKASVRRRLTKAR